MKYSIEDDYNKDLKVEGGCSGDAKITYTPGTVSREADEATAQLHREELERDTGLELGVHTIKAGRSYMRRELCIARPI